MEVDWGKFEKMSDEELLQVVLDENPDGIWNAVEAVGCASQNCYAAWWRR
jgi:hypothetical protein